MKEVKLVERKSTARLLSLIGEIPELILNNDFISARGGRPMYYLTTGNIWTMYNRGEINKNPLKNAYKLKLACDNGIRKITEESFCDLLEEHLYLVAKEKMDELLPQIQEHYPKSELYEHDGELEIVIWFDTEFDVSGDNSVRYNQKKHKIEVDNLHDDVWEDKENLIVAKPKPWWETQDHFYSISLDYSGKTVRMVFMQCSLYTSSRNMVGKNAGKTMFKNREEAEVMCNKINAVLKGE